MSKAVGRSRGIDVTREDEIRVGRVTEGWGVGGGKEQESGTEVVRCENEWHSRLSAQRDSWITMWVFYTNAQGDED